MPIANPGGAKHWSEAFVEHLRTVHLALISVSVGLILVIASSKPYDPARALVEVKQILQLQKDWSPTWVLANLRTRVDQTAVSKEVPDQTFAITIGQPFTCGITGPNKRERALSCIAHRDWVEPTNRYRRELPFGPGQRGRLLPAFSVTSFPTTFWQFRAWWDELLDRARTVSFAHVIANGTAKGPDPNEKWVYYDGEVSATPRGAPVELKLNLTSDSGAYEGTVDEGRTTITLPVTAIEECEIDRAALKRIFPNWGTESFDKAFPDLAKALGSFYEVSIEDMKDRLSQETGKGEESFELFSLKLPVRQLTTWGALILLSLQLYFYLHLSELSKKLGVDDPGWDIPWIGMYESRISRSLFFLSSCAIPTVVVGLLAFYSSSSMLRDLPSWSALRDNKLLVAWMCCFAVAVFASALLSFLSWKYRPRVSPADDTDQQAASAQSARSKA
jgi:hypothetical protein